MNAAERQAKIESYGRAYETLTAALDKFPREMWHYRGQRDPWTIYEVIVHISDSEANSYARCRRCIAEPGSTVMAYDENVWAKMLNYGEQSADDAIELFRWLRNNTYKLINMQPEAVWSQTIMHPENGLMTLDDWLLVYEDHIPAHVRQMRLIYEEWKAAQPVN
jgi:hypothetical protein